MALLLGLLGVDSEDIVADYAATAANMPAVLERIRSSPFFQSNGLAAAPAWIFGAEPATMRGFLYAVEEQFGDAQPRALPGPRRPARHRSRTCAMSSPEP